MSKSQNIEMNIPVRMVLIIDAGFPNTTANISVMVAIIKGIQIDNFMLQKMVSSIFFIISRSEKMCIMHCEL